MVQHPVSYYARQVRESLTPAVFRPVRSRLLWLALHIGIVAVGTWAVWRGVGGWWALPLWSLLIGHSYAGMAFVGHETMHGAVVRNNRLRYLVGWVCFMPFKMAPRLWVAWHNRVHHGHTMQDGVDPDAYPTLASWKERKIVRVADYLACGRDRKFWWLTLAIGFSGQSQQMLWRWLAQTGELPAHERRLAKAETLLAGACFIALGLALGLKVFFFAHFVPLLVGNCIVIAYILTNHSLSPLTATNDPLLNSLSVTLPRPLEILHLNFGYHVEHHLFPSMSSKFGPRVRDELMARWPERYQTLPLLTAVARVVRTPRVYRDDHTLYDPLTGYSESVILPRSAGATADDKTAAGPAAPAAPGDAAAPGSVAA